MAKFKMSRRRMCAGAAAASGLGAIFKMTGGPAMGQAQTPPPGQTGAPAAPGGAQPGRGGRSGGGRGGGRGGAVELPPVSKLSAPSDLRITGMRSLRVAANFDYPIIRIDTNQGLYGLGEVRDAGSEYSALAMKPFLVGRNPLDFDNLMSYVLPYAGSGRAGGGYSAIDLALNDIIGKAYGVPVWRLLGSKKRATVRMYCDTTGTHDPKAYGQRMLERQKKGFTFFKMDVTTNFISGEGKPGALDPVTGVPTDKGLAYGAELVAAVRDAIGYDKPWPSMPPAFGADRTGRNSRGPGLREIQAGVARRPVRHRRFLALEGVQGHQGEHHHAPIDRRGRLRPGGAVRVQASDR